MIDKNSCPICESINIIKFLTRKNLPVHQNLLFSDQKSAISATRGDLNLKICRECGFVFNSTFDLSKLSYGEKYDNTQDLSAYFHNYVSNLATSIIQDKKIQNCIIVEIGCGKGTFLRKLVESEEWKNVGYGFDPSYQGPETDLDGRLNFQKRFYDSDCTNVDADVIVCRHVIEHVPDPINLLKMIKKSLKPSKQVHIFFETPTVEWILKNKVLYDFFYEHCSYFSASSLSTAFEISGFKIEKVKTIFNGQYLWFEAINTTEKIQPRKNSDSLENFALEYSKDESNLKEDWTRKVQDLALDGTLAIWGAGAKGVTFVNLIDPKREYIDCIIDVNVNKQGKFLPGTGHPIINYKEIPSKKINKVILMNPNYYDEIVNLLKESKIEIDIIN